MKVMENVQSPKLQIGAKTFFVEVSAMIFKYAIYFAQKVELFLQYNLSLQSTIKKFLKLNRILGLALGGSKSYSQFLKRSASYPII